MMGLHIAPRTILHLIVLLIAFWNVSAQRAKSAEQVILERIFADRTYDQRVRPVTSSNASAPVHVNVNLYLRSVEMLDDKHHQYSVQLTYRQKWKDERLSFSPTGGIHQINLINPHNQIWRPDTFFANEKEGKYHELMSRNEFVRVTSKGDVMQSSRISLRLSCPMNFQNFPLDTQTCSIRLASYGYTVNDVKYEWDKPDPVQIMSSLIIPNFFLEGAVTSTCDSVTTTGSYSCLRVDFTFKRVFSPYLLNVYIPCVMMVIVSWLSFWVNAQAITGRLLLTVLTLFVLAIQTADVNKLFPLTSYTKAIDTWTGTCLTFVMAALVEFIVVHYISRRKENERKSSNIELRDQLEEEANTVEPTANRDEEQEIPLKDPSLNDGKDEQGNGNEGAGKTMKAKLTKRVEDYSRRYLSKFNSLPEKIDGASRVLFPLAFLLFNIFYWIAVSI